MRAVGLFVDVSAQQYSMLPVYSSFSFVKYLYSYVISLRYVLIYIRALCILTYIFAYAPPYIYIFMCRF